MNSNFFPHLNVQTNSNLSHSLINISKLVDWAVSKNIKNLAIADFYPYDFLHFYNLCKEKKINSLIGIKIIIKDEEKQYLLTIYPQNNAGYKELIQKLFNFSSPLERIFSLEEIITCQKNCLLVFIAHSLEDIIYFSQKPLFPKKNESPSSFYIGFDFFIHNPKKDVPNSVISCLLPFFAVKMIDQEDLYLYSSLTKTSFSQSFVLPDVKQRFISYLKEEDFFSVFTNDRIFYKIMLLQVKDFIKKINLKISFLSSKSEERKNDFAELQNRCEKQLFFSQVSSLEKYETRLKEELQIINKLGYTRYFLIFSEIINDLRKQNIIIGPGRGSAVSSLVTYLLGITKIDPLKYNLFFERFLNERRNSLPDIDIDVENRSWLINYLQTKYGKDKIALISTRQKLGWKRALKESIEIASLSKKKLVINEQQKKDILNCVKDDSLGENLKSKALQSKFNHLFVLAEKIKNLYSNHSLHASGIVISEKKPLFQLIPCRKEKDFLVSYYAEKDLNSLGLKKYDFLNLNSLANLREIRDILPQKRLPKLNLQDKATWKLINNCMISGIPQLDTPSFRELISKFQPQIFSDLVLILALNRPGVRQNIETILRQKNRGAKESSSTIVQDILAETFGFIVFEEQISQLLSFIFDYSFSEAEINRRKLNNLNEEEILQQFKKDFLHKAQNKLSLDESQKLWEQIINSNQYTFNKAHAVAYSYLSYYFAFLKAKYFSLLIVYFLNSNLNSPEKTLSYLQEALFYGFSIQKPDINYSENKWSAKNKTIFMGFSSLSNYQPSFFQFIIEQREQKGTFNDWEDFISRTSGQWAGIELSTFQKWIRLGLFNSLKINIDYLIENSEIIFRYCQLKNFFSTESRFLPALDWKKSKSSDFSNQLDINQKEWENWSIYISYFHHWTEAKKVNSEVQTFAKFYADLKKNGNNSKKVNLVTYSIIQDIQNKNNRFWLTLYDLNSSFRLIIDQNFYEKNKELIKVHQSLVFHLTAKVDNYKIQNFQLDNVEKISF